MTFLKKLGQIINTVGQVVGIFAPAVTQLFPGSKEAVQVVSKDIVEIAEAVVLAETIGQAKNLPGPEKLQFITPVVAQIILKSTLVANKKIENPALFMTGSQKLADGMADILNSLRAADVKSDSLIA